jgi:pyruvate/2-oxoglutarate dehydrogenase complex dihydrolipoamide dehydrogenase (E3) component
MSKSRPKTYDFLVIGGGSAGFNAARVAVGLGLKTAIVDGAQELGGLCILRGCMPSKTLLYMTEVLHLAQQGRTFGLKIPSARADMKAMQARKKKIIREFASYREAALTSGKFDLIRAHARFLDAHTLALSDGRTVRARHILLGTGSKVSVPPIPGLAESGFWTSDDVLDLDYIPKSVIVLGGGVSLGAGAQVHEHAAGVRPGAACAGTGYHADRIFGAEDFLEVGNNSTQNGPEL